MNKIINWCRGVNNWFIYVISYKENKENDLINDKKIIEKNKQIEKLKKEIENYKNYENEKINIIKLREKDIKKLSTKIHEYKSQLKEITEKLLHEQEENMQLNKKLETKEHERRTSAGAVGAKQKKINRLKKEIEELNKQHTLEILSKNATIEYLKKHRRAPTKEEVIAYELSLKEVEKRINNKQ